MKNTIYFRYEFSDESGRPEGGDVFQYTSLAQVQDMVTKVLKVANGDKVSVNLTIGVEKPFFGYLGKGGLNRKDVEKEMVGQELLKAAAKKKTSKKASKKKKSKKA